MSSGPQARPLPDDAEERDEMSTAKAVEVVGVGFVILYTLWASLIVPALLWLTWMPEIVAGFYVGLMALLWLITVSVGR